MKKSIVLLTLVTLAFSCSSDDDVLSDDVYFKADVDGEIFEVNEFSGFMTTEKRISTIGTVDLAVRMESAQGKSIEFMIMNYNGKNSYSMGDGYYNENWIKYSQSTPLGSWGVSKNFGPGPGNINRIEIIKDDGRILRGNFSFEGREQGGTSRKMITNGDFNLVLRN